MKKQQSFSQSHLHSLLMQSRTVSLVVSNLTLNLETTVRSSMRQATGLVSKHLLVTKDLVFLQSAKQTLRTSTTLTTSMTSRTSG